MNAHHPRGALRRAAALAAAGVPALLTAPLLADDFFWIGDGNPGTVDIWTVDDNWLGGLVPGPLDTAIFDLAFQTDINVPAGGPGIEFGRAIYRSGSWALLSLNNSVSAAGGTPFDPTIVVGQDAEARLQLRMSIGAFGNDLGHVLVGDTAPGVLEFSGVADVATLEVGRHAAGSVIDGVGPGRTIRGQSMVIGAGGAGASIVELNGGDLEFTGPVDVGLASVGILGRENARPRLSAGTLQLGGVPGAMGVAWTRELAVSGDLDIGILGGGTLGVSSVAGEPSPVDGDLVLGLGVLDVDGIILGSGDGSLIVEDLARLEVAGDLVIGLGGGGRVEIAPAATIAVDGDVDTIGIDDLAIREVVFEIATPRDTPMLDAAGSVALPDVVVRFQGDDFTPAIGSEWRLVESDGMVGWESLSLPALGPGRGWRVDDDAGQLRIIVVQADNGPPGDVDGDGVVNIIDLVTVLANFGPCGDSCPADENGDGVVDFLDLLIVLDNWTA